MIAKRFAATVVLALALGLSWDAAAQPMSVKEIAQILVKAAPGSAPDFSQANLAGLDLSGDAVITRLKDVAATHKGVSNPTACVTGATLINSANPTESVLLKRVKGTQNCGTPMPFAPGLTGANLKCVEDWVMKF